MDFDFQSELAELRQLKSDPNNRPELVLQEAEKLSRRWANQMEALADAGSKEVVVYLGNNA